MKRLLPALTFLLILSCVVSVPSASARGWWHRHHKDSANHSTSNKPPKAKRSWFHHEKREKANTEPVASMTNGPRSIGHWHPMPGPVGAGAR